MGSDRTEFHVVPRHGRWQITRNGQRVSVSDRKVDAIDRAVAQARQAQPSQLIIHATDGRIEDERTYLADPYPRPG